MFQYYTPVLLLQIFCWYHAYKHRKDYFWYFLVFFLPLIGAIIYIVTQVFTKNDIAKASDEFTAVIMPSKNVKDAQKRLNFVDSFQNKMLLADAYFENGDYENARIQYENALQGNLKNNFYEAKKLVKSIYFLEKYEEVIALTEKMKNHHEFSGSDMEYTLGLALSKLGKNEAAEKHLKVIDKRYSNYEERLTLSKFYHEQGKTENAVEILDEILSESQNMTSPNRKRYRHVIQEVRRFKKELSSY